MFDQFVVFLRTTDLERTSRFYGDVLQLTLVRDQGVCRIYKISADGYLGFCTHLQPADRDGIIATLVVDDVDGWHARLKASGVEIIKPPAHNPKYQIYHFFFKDPNGYLLEIQRFDEPLA
jgi:catechol 2,3-dioxygenase-like lactoylglutathione lyase family enzyme